LNGRKKELTQVNTTLLNELQSLDSWSRKIHRNYQDQMKSVGKDKLRGKLKQDSNQVPEGSYSMESQPNL